MAPTDQLQVAAMPVPTGMNTVLPYDKLPPNRSPYILNLYNRDGQMVGRHGWRSYTLPATTVRYPFSALTLGQSPTFSSMKALVYNYSLSTSGTYFISIPDLAAKQEATGIDSPGFTLTIITSLASNNSEFMIHAYNDTALTEISTASTTDLSTYIPGNSNCTYNYSAYANRIGFNTQGIHPIRWGGSQVTTTASATYTFTLGSATATYTGLSPSSYTSLPNQILTAASGLSYRIVTQNVSTSTTGSVILDTPWRDANAVTALSSANIVLMSNNISTLPTYIYNEQYTYSTGIYRERLWLGTSGGWLVWSKPGQPDAFSNANYVQVSKDGGGIFALHQFDNQFFIFKSDAIYVLSGYDEGTFTLRLLTDSIGCTDPTSIVELNGVMYFANKNGFYAYTGGVIREVSSEIANLWHLMFQGPSETVHGKLGVGTIISAVVMKNRYIMVSLTNVFALNSRYLYSLLYDAELGTWTMIGRTSSDHKNMNMFFLRGRFGRPWGVSANGLNDVQDALEPIPLGQSLGINGNYSEWGVDAGGAGTGNVASTEVIYTLVSPLYELTPGHTSRVFQVDLHHSGLYAGTTPTTNTSLAVTVYKDTNAAYPYGGTPDQFNTAVNTTPLQISYNKTNTSNATIYPRLNFVQRLMDPTTTNFDCNTFSITLTSDPAIVGANETQIIHSFEKFVIRYTSVRQSRVQD